MAPERQGGMADFSGQRCMSCFEIKSWVTLLQWYCQGYTFKCIPNTLLLNYEYLYFLLNFNFNKFLLLHLCVTLCLELVLTLYYFLTNQSRIIILLGHFKLLKQEFSRVQTILPNPEALWLKTPSHRVEHGYTAGQIFPHHTCTTYTIT